MLIKCNYFCIDGPSHNKTSLKCAVSSHNTMPQILQVLAAEISSKAFACELNVHSHKLQSHFRKIGRTSNWPCNHRCVTTPAQDLHIRLLHLKPAFWTADAVAGLRNQRISVEIVRNHLREAHLFDPCPNSGFDLTAV